MSATIGVFAHMLIRDVHFARSAIFQFFLQILQSFSVAKYSTF